MLLVLWFMVPLAEFTKGCVQPFLYNFDATKLKVEEDTSTFEAQAKEDKSALEDLLLRICSHTKVDLEVKVFYELVIIAEIQTGLA